MMPSLEATKRQHRCFSRFWITLVVDVFSRMVTGFYVSFDPLRPV